MGELGVMLLWYVVRVVIFTPDFEEPASPLIHLISNLDEVRFYHAGSSIATLALPS